VNFQSFIKSIRRRELAPMSTPERKGQRQQRQAAAELEPITHSGLTRDSLEDGKACPRRVVVGVVRGCVSSRFGSDAVEQKGKRRRWRTRRTSTASIPRRRLDNPSASVLGRWQAVSFGAHDLALAQEFGSPSSSSNTNTTTSHTFVDHLAPALLSLGPPYKSSRTPF
jgi:hypothetical protein